MYPSGFIIAYLIKDHQQQLLREAAQERSFRASSTRQRIVMRELFQRGMRSYCLRWQSRWRRLSQRFCPGDWQQEIHAILVRRDAESL